MKYIIILLFLFLVPSQSFADTFNASSNYSGALPSYLGSTDNNYYWFTSSYGYQWISVTFPKSTQITSVSYLQFSDFGYNSPSIDLEYTTDGTSWILYKSYRNLITSNSYINLYLENPVTCIAFRLVKPSGNFSWCVRKLYYSKGVAMTDEQYTGLINAINGGVLTGPVMGMNPSHFNFAMGLCGISAALVIFVIWSRSL